MQIHLRILVSVKDLNGQEARLDQFHVRFRDADKIEQYSATHVFARTTEHFQTSLKSREPSIDLNNVKVNSDTLMEVDSAPSFQFYRNAMCHNLGPSEHETFNHAVACEFIPSIMPLYDSD